MGCMQCSDVGPGALWSSGSGWSHPEFTPMATGATWTGSPQPPSLARARNQYPDAQVVMRDTRHRLHVVEGTPNDWWHDSRAAYDLAHVLHLREGDGRDLLLAGVALDPEIRHVVWSRAYGRYAFYLTRDLVVLLGFRDEARYVELSQKLRRVHRPRLALRYPWPKPVEVERALRG